MNELLEALESIESRARRRRRAWRAALGTAALVSLVFWIWAAGPSRACEREVADSAPAWDAATAARVRRSFEATGLDADARVAFATVDARMRSWQAKWRQSAEGSCARESSGEPLRERLRHRACLQRRLRAATTLRELWSDADADLVRAAPLSVVELSDPSTCEAPPAGAGANASPPGEEGGEGPAGDAAASDEVLARIAEARVLMLSGKSTAATELLEAAEREAEGLRSLLLQSKVAMVRAGLAEGRGDFAAAEAHLLAAIWAAEAGREDEVAADAWLELVWIVGVEQRRSAQGSAWLPFAEAATARAGVDPLRAATLDHNRAGVDFVGGRRSAALAGYRRALVVQREQLGSGHPRVARTLNHIGNVLLEDEDYVPALGYAERSLEIRERSLGPRHPLVAASLNNVAVARLELGQLAKAREAIDRALSITAGSARSEQAVSERIERRLRSREARGARVDE